MSDHETEAFTRGGVIGCYIVGVLYSFLTILLSTRLFYKVKETANASRHIAIWVLFGFVIACLARAVSLFWIGATKEAIDNVLILPTVLFFILVLVLIVMWNRWLTVRQGVPSIPRRLLMILLVALNCLLLSLITWRVIKRSSMFKHQDEVIVFLDVATCFVASIALAVVARQLRKEARSHMNDENSNARKLFIGCTVLTLYTLARGAWILVVNRTPALWGIAAQSAIIPIFYAIQWFALLASVGMLVGPQPKAPLATSISARQVDVAYLNAQDLRSPLHSQSATINSASHY